MAPTTCWNLRVSAEANQGGRKYMEDVTAVHFERTNGVEFASFAIFDGHGGREASHFAKDKLMGFIKKEKGFFSTRCDVVKKAIRAGFLACHQAMWKKLPDWPKTAMGHPCTAGTTAALVIIRGNKLYVAHCGDSAVFMGTSVSDESTVINCKELTEDHKPESTKERRRIETAGGSVVVKSGVNRVVWERPKIGHTGAIRRSTELDRIPFLAVARSLGDLWSWNKKTEEFVVSPEPDVEVHDLNRCGSRFIILASDGVTNMIKPDNAVSMVADFEERKRRGDVQGTSAHELVHESLSRWAARGMRADNSSAIVVFIEKKKMEPKNGGTVEYTERWTSANKSELTKSFAKGGNTKKEQIKNEPTEVKPEPVERKPLQEVKTERKSDVMGSKSAHTVNRKRNSTENNNENQSPASKRLRVPEPTSKPTRRRSTRIAVKRCEHGLTRSAARKRASL
jgi:protein phosphatase 1D